MKQYLILFTFFVLVSCGTTSRNLKAEPIPCIVKTVEFYKIDLTDTSTLTPYWIVTVESNLGEYKIKFYIDPEVNKGDIIEIYKKQK